MYQLFDLGKYCIGLFFVSKKLSNLWIVKQFFEDGIYYSLANLWADLAKYLPKLLRVFFSYDVNVEVCIDLLLDDFWSDSVVFLLFPSLSGYGEISSRSIYYIADFFFLKHNLSKVSSLRLILKAMELFTLALAIIIIVNHLDDLDYDIKCNNAGAYTGSHNLIKSLI